MVQTLEAVKGGGGSVRIGTTGTISSLMTKELESMKHPPQTPRSSRVKPPTVPVTPVSSRIKPPTVPVSVPCSVSTPKRQPRRIAANEASTSGSSSRSNSINHRSPGSTQKPRHSLRKNTHRIPMLGSEDIAVDRTPNREKSDKKGSYIVEVVDLKCGDSEKAWSSPITNRLKKLSFSKLSETIGTMGPTVS